MFISPTDALTVLEHYKYWLIFPIAVIEGPIIIIISGFLVYLGFLNPFVAFAVLLVADMTGDFIYYTIGRKWRTWTWIKKYARYLGYSEKSEAFLENHFKKHKGKTFLLAKISHGIGGAVQISAGIAHVDIKEFLFYSFIGTIGKTIGLMLIGFYLGSSYIKIDGVFNWIGLVTFGVVCLLVLLYILITKYTKKYMGENK